MAANGKPLRGNLQYKRFLMQPYNHTLHTLHKSDFFRVYPIPVRRVRNPQNPRFKCYAA